MNPAWLGLVLLGLPVMLLAHEFPARTPLERYQEWRAEIQRLRVEPELMQIEGINRYINQRIAFNADLGVWGREDYWATPRETIERGRGDCEDYAIAKFFSLRQLGIAHDKLRLVHVKARIGGPGSTLLQEHMVLAYYPQPGADPLILDSLLTTLYPASVRTDLEPVYSFNGDSVSLKGKRLTTDSLRNWQALLDKMEFEQVPRRPQLADQRQLPRDSGEDGI